MAISTNPGTDGLVAEFVCGLGYEDMPPEVVDQALLCLVDLVGVAAAGSCTPMSSIARQYAVDECPAGARTARLLFDGLTVAPTGAAFANAATLDSFDAHDGHALTKGHAGAAVLPAALALGGGASGHDLITAVVLGYEIATRAGIALHRSAADYHSSGSWNSIGCAAIGARLLGLDAVRTNHALGIVEYHGPRGPMMRSVATAAAYGEVPVTVLTAPTAANANVLRLSESMIVKTVPDYDQAFPAQRFADVTLVLRDGRILRSDTTSAQGSPEDPMSSEQIAAKYRDLTTPVVGAVRSAHIESAIQGLRTNEPIHVLYDSIFAETRHLRQSGRCGKLR